MKKIITFNLVLLCAFLMTGCGQTTDPVNTNTPPINTTPTTETNATVTVPDGWSKVDGSVLDMQYMKNTASFMMKKEYFSSTDLDKITEEAISTLQQAFDNMKVQGDVEKITVDGHDARKLIFTCEVSNIQMKFIYVYTLVDNDIYAITFGDMESTFDNLSADYDKILEQIRF